MTSVAADHCRHRAPGDAFRSPRATPMRRILWSRLKVGRSVILVLVGTGKLLFIDN